MGNATNLIIEKAGDKTQSINIAERGNAVCLLWICCFRINDDARDYNRLRCPVERAITQLKDGVEVLEKYFGPISDLDDSLKKLEAVLEENRDGNLVLEYRDQPYLVEILLYHSLLGFWDPDIKFYYTEQQIKDWGVIDLFGMITGDWFAPPPSSGVMTWIGAIKRICFPYNQTRQTPEQYDLGGPDTFDWSYQGGYFPNVHLIGNFGID
jgi:hypothetical protein